MRRAAAKNKKPIVDEKVRNYLRPDEANRLIGAAAKLGRQGLRDAVMLRLIYRHGLRVSEATGARWTDLSLDGDGVKVFHVRRLKGSLDSVHSLDRDEVSGLRKLRQASEPGVPWLFVSEHGGPLSTDNVARIVTRAAEAADLGLKVNPHMLRHSAGYALANQGVDTRLIQAHLGHASIANTVRYTQLAPQRLAAVRVR